jgi:hypothetical protein
VGSMQPLYIEFYLDGKLFGCRRGIGGFPGPASHASPVVGDTLMLGTGCYVVTERVWDFVSEDKIQGLRLVIEKSDE